MYIYIKTTKDKMEGKKEERGMTYITTRYIQKYTTVMNYYILTRKLLAPFDNLSLLSITEPFDPLLKQPHQLDFESRIKHYSFWPIIANKVMMR